MNQATPNLIMQSTKASDYRLAKKADNEIVLVGAFEWSGINENGHMCGGTEWREIPMIDMPINVIYTP